jgi:hypothetical protein
MLELKSFKSRNAAMLATFAIIVALMTVPVMSGVQSQGAITQR